MKILYLVHQFYPEYYSGTEKVVYNIASMMQQFGNKVKVIAYSFQERSFYSKSFEDVLVEEYLYKKLPVLAFRHNQIPSDLNIQLTDSAITRFAFQVLSTEKPDILHVGHSMRMSGFIHAAKQLGIPYVMTLTDFSLICPKINLTTSYGNLCSGPQGGLTCSKFCSELPGDFINNRLAIAVDILTGARQLFAPSNFLANIFQNELKNITVSVMKHGLKYRHIKEKDDHVLQDGKITFGYVGTIAPHKGVHILIDAFKKIANKNVSLLIYGSGDDKHYIDSIKYKVDDDDRIKMCGVFVEKELGTIFNNFDVLIVPSLCYESFSYVLHEALACNLPVICSDAGAMSEAIDAKTGFLFRMGDATHLAQIMASIIDNCQMINSLKENISTLMVPTIEQEAYFYKKVYVMALDNQTAVSSQ